MVLRTRLALKDVSELKKDIASNGFTVRSFAHESNVSYGYMSQILNGKQPSPKVAKKIADSLDKKIADIFSL